MHPIRVCTSFLTRSLSRTMSTTRTKPYTVIVEGNIGSGKTTFLQPFLQNPNIEVCPEPVEKWRNLQGHNLLQKMYQDPSRWSMLLQTYIQLTMVQLHNQPCQRPVKIMERSLLRRAFEFWTLFKRFFKVCFGFQSTPVLFWFVFQILPKQSQRYAHSSYSIIEKCSKL